MGRVGTQVHEDLMNLGRIRKDHAGLILESLVDLDGGGQCGPEELQAFLDKWGQLNGFLLCFVLTAEAEDLLNKVLCPVSGAQDPFHVF